MRAMESPSVNRMAWFASTLGILDPMRSPIQAVVPLGLHWPTLDPFLFCAHHRDEYPPGNANQGVDPSALAGRNVGSDFTLKDGWRMYHGREVPGFPQHPHRGFETVTIARSGYIDHADSLGAQARFGQGDVQWMTAGRGVVHSEMFPLVDATADNPAELFQIWLNLPSTSKLVDPYFTMIWSDQIATARHTDAAGHTTVVTVVAGALGAAQGAATPPDSWAADPAHGVNIWTIRMEPGATWTLPATEPNRSRVVYAYQTGGLSVAGQQSVSPAGFQVDPTAAIEIVNGADPTELLLLEGQPIGEPVAQHGPFVMNTRAELATAFRDYERDHFGGWPWPSNGPVLPRAEGRFARHADGRIERP